MIEFLIIFVAKIIEVSLSTLKSVFVIRGEKIYASLIGSIEISMWLGVASKVLATVNEDPTKAVAYVLGYGIGVYVGLTIEEFLALGYSMIQIIVPKKEGNIIAKEIRNAGFGVTTMNGEGMDSDKVIILTHSKRKEKKNVLKVVERMNINAVISITDTKHLRGGYGLNKDRY